MKITDVLAEQRDEARSQRDDWMSSSEGWQKQAAELKAENAALFDAIDTACNLLQMVGEVWSKDGCFNCEYEWLYHDFGHPDNHSTQCDIPTVFAKRDQVRRGIEREKLKKEVRG
jgi:hypothetical protein